jgi:hypothetical protein
MSYVITTKTGEAVTRRSADTLADVRRICREIEAEHIDADDHFVLRYFAWKSDYLTEAGGVIGVLPDGTSLAVARRQ